MAYVAGDDQVDYCIYYPMVSAYYPMDTVMRGSRGPRTLSKKTIPQLQNTLWPLFSKYIKRTHSSDGIHCSCYTCGKSLVIGDRDCQAGHWIPRTYSPTKYDENNVRPQCSRCNEFNAGMPVEFERNLRLEVGSEMVEYLKVLSTQPWKWNKGKLIDQIEYYKGELHG